MNLMIVDDDNVSRMAIAQILSSLTPQEPLQADSGKAAMQALKQGYQPDLIITDVRMPEIDGMEMLDIIRQDSRFGLVPVMMVTSAPEQTVVRQAMQIGVQGFILKPLTEDAVKRVRAVVDRFHASLLEGPQSAVRRLSISEAKYWGYLNALLVQNRKLVECVRLIRGGAEDTSQGDEAAVQKMMDTCLGISKMFAITHLNKALLNLEILFKTRVSARNIRLEEVIQAIELYLHWLEVYIQHQAPMAGTVENMASPVTTP